MTFGQKIRELRNKKGWTVYQLAEALADEKGQKSAGYISKIEARGEIPSPNMIIKLSKVLCTDAEELFDIAKKEKTQAVTQNVNKKYDEALTLYRKSRKK